MRFKTALDLLVTVAIGVAAFSVTWRSWSEPRGVAQPPRKPPPAFEDISSSGWRTSIVDAPTTGSGVAPIVLIEYSDFECPFCARHAAETFDLIRDEFIANGSLQYVFRNYPIEQIHPSAVKAAHAGRCAHEQGKFMEMRTRLFADQRALAQLDLTHGEIPLGLDSTRFGECMAGAGTSDFRDEKREAERLGVSSTPAFLLGKRQKSGEVLLNVRMAGARPFALFKEQIERLMNRNSAIRGS